MYDSMMLKKRIWALALSILGFGTALLLSPSLAGYNAFNIGLTRFEAVATEDGIQLEWDVETEIGTAGYTIKRGEGGSFDYLVDPQTGEKLFVLAEGGPSQARDYSFLDESAVRDRTYVYQLLEITTGSSEQVQDEFTITYQIVATNTPVTFSGDTGSNQANNGPTATPTATLPATATTLSQAPAPATNAQSPAVTAPTPLPGNSNNDPAASQPDGLQQPLATAAPQQEAYPGDSTVVGQEQGGESGADSAPSADAGTDQVITDESGVEGTFDDAATSAYPGAVNALETTTTGQPVLGNEKPPPVVIVGSTAVPVNDPYPAPAEVQEPANADSTRILLWLAFLVSLIIFTASVVGSILLYSRQRSAK